MILSIRTERMKIAKKEESWKRKESMANFYKSRWLQRNRRKLNRDRCHSNSRMKLLHFIHLNNKNNLWLTSAKAISQCNSKLVVSQPLDHGKLKKVIFILIHLLSSINNHLTCHLLSSINNHLTFHPLRCISLNNLILLTNSNSLHILTGQAKDLLKFIKKRMPRQLSVEKLMLTALN